jgi:hypothetical protein
MTVGDLRDVLADYPRDMPVVMAKDGEGNGHSPLADVDVAMYVPDSTWSGEVYATPEEIADPDSIHTDEDEAPDGAVRVLLLGPVN